jgi:beta-lactam-binding protein with PASTA domain
VLTQTPPANAGGVDGPRVSLLVSDADPDATQPPAYAMPSLVGLSYAAANARAASAGLHLVAVTESALPTAAPAGATAAAASTGPAQNGQSAPATPTAPPALNPAQNGLPAPAPAAATGRSFGIVTAQSPQAGRRVVQGDVVHVTLGHSAPPAAASPAQPAAAPAATQ